MKKRKILEIAVISAVAIATALFIELFVLHLGDFFKQHPEKELLSLSDAYLTGSACFDKDGNIKIVGNSEAAIIFNQVPDDFRSIRLTAYGEEGYKKINISARNTNSEYRADYEYHFSPSSLESQYFEVNNGANSFIITLRSCDGLTVQAIALNTLPDFEFYFLRFIIIFLTVFFLIVIIKYKLLSTVFDYRNKKHNAAIALTVILMVCCCAFISTFYSAYTVEYPITDDSLAYGNYVQQTDAFIKGQIELDINIPDELFNCDNPYDPLDRRANRVNTNEIWDKSFYNGKLYSYFGVVPVAAVYMPAYYLTGRMATDMLPCFIFSLMAVVFIALLMRELTIRYIKKAKLILLCLGIFAVAAAGLVFIMESSANFYTVAVMGGIAFLPAFLYFIFRAVRAERTLNRCLLFAAAGACLACMVGCRPNVALYGVAVLPALFGVLAEKQTKPVQKIYMVLAFATPALLGIAALCVYNSMRFSGPFDFGNNYQLTVSDVSQNTLRLHLLPEAIFHYFLQPPALSSAFPFTGLSRIRLESYNVDYIYIGENLGAMAFACNWALIPGLLLEVRRKKLEKSLFCIITVLTAVIIAFMDFCLAGAHIRYTTDIMMMVAIVSVVLLLSIDSRFKSKKVTVLFSCLMLAAIFVGLIICFDNEVDLIMHNSADLLLTVQRMFSILK